MTELRNIKDKVKQKHGIREHKTCVSKYECVPVVITASAENMHQVHQNSWLYFGRWQHPQTAVYCQKGLVSHYAEQPMKSQMVNQTSPLNMNLITFDAAM